MKLFIIFYFFLSTLFSPGIEEEKVPWREGKKLTWSMFKGQPENLGNFVASTNSGISLSFGIRTMGDEVQVDYSVQSYFYPNDSWYSSGNVTEIVLAHEQTHFDISELFARKLRQKFDAIPKTKDFKKYAKEIYHKNEEDRVNMQDQFDKQTDHSRLEKVELKWEAFVQDQLERYNDWK